MKAIRIHNYGGPEVLVYEEIPEPTPGAGEVLVKVYASSLNPVDYAIRAGYLRMYADFPMPHVPGFDLAGVVEAVGEGVSTVVVGDEVYGNSNFMRQGTHAEYALLSIGELAPKPASLDFVTAAVVPHAGLTAWQGLFDVAGLQAGQTLLIHGAAGGVGSFAVQFAVAKGAQVFATAGSDKIALLHELGVAEPIDYTTTRFEQVVPPVDVVFDLVGGELVERSLTLLKPGGIYVSPVAQLDAEVGRARGVRAVGMIEQPNAAQLREIAGMIDAGTVMAVVSSVFPLAEIQQAHTQFAAGHTRGKIALRVVSSHLLPLQR